MGDADIPNPVNFELITYHICIIMKNEKGKIRFDLSIITINYKKIKQLNIQFKNNCHNKP